MSEKIKKPLVKSLVIDLDENKILPAKFIYKNGELAIKYRVKLFPPKRKIFFVDEKYEYYLVIEKNIYKMELPLQLNPIDYDKLLSNSLIIGMLNLSSLNMVNILMLIIGILLGLVIGIFISPQVYHPPPQSRLTELFEGFFRYILLK